MDFLYFFAVAGRILNFLCSGLILRGVKPDLPLRAESLDAIEDIVDGRLILLVLGGVLCLGMALGLDLFPRFAARESRPRKLEPSDALRIGPLIEPQAAAPRASLSFAQLLQILSPRQADPAARRFVASYMADAGLRRLYEGFASGRDDRPAAEFAAALLQSDAFAELVRRFAPDPAFRRLADSVVRHPEVGRLLRGMRPPGAAPAAAALFAPSGRDADTIGAEEGGTLSPVGDIKAPGKPLER